jgi:hypothetical protein
LGPEEQARGEEPSVLPGSETARLFADPDTLDTRLNALKGLCRRKWFTRLWIYQEYQLSKAAIGFVSRRTLNLRDLYKVLRFMTRHPTGKFRTETIGHIRNLLQPTTESKSPSIVTWTMKRSFCSDERDRVYAILGLLAAEYRAEIVLDYTNSPQDVKKEFFLCQLKLGRAVSISACGDEHQSEFPSWTPSLSPKLSTLERCRASETSKHGIMYESADESPRLPAKRIDTIAEIWFTVPNKPITRDTLETIRVHKQRNLVGTVYSLGGDMLDAYVSSLVSGRYHERLRFPWILPLQELRHLVQDRDSSEDLWVKAKSSLVHLKGRAIFSTTDGLLGICPASGQVGDPIYISLVLRRPSFYPV